MEPTSERARPATKLRDTVGQVLAEARAVRPRPALDALLEGYKANDLLTYASAISFRVFFALIPLALFVLGVLGFLHLEEVWRNDIAPDMAREEHWNKIRR